jgi:hypothetical protein
MLADQNVLLFGSLLLGLFLLHRIQQVKQVWQAFGNLPAHFILVSPLEDLSRILPRIPWISDRPGFSWKNVHERQLHPRVSIFYLAHSPHLDVFAASNSDIVQLRSLFPCSIPQLLLADATAAKVGPVST